MASVTYTVTLDENYAVPETHLTAEEYVNFVMNHAAKSYMNRYSTSFADAVQAACDAYNETVVEETPVEE